jgi:hypothetical protein
VNVYLQIGTQTKPVLTLSLFYHRRACLGAWDAGRGVCGGCVTKGGPQKLSSVHPSARIIYDAKKQFETKTSKAPLLNAKEKKHPESMWQNSISWPRSRFNNTLPNKRNSITIIEAYYRHNEADDAIVRLFGITRGGSYYLQ